MRACMRSRMSRSVPVGRSSSTRRSCAGRNVRSLPRWPLRSRCISIFDCRAALPLLRQRLEQRQASGRDPSEADMAVLERLSEADEPRDERERAVALVVDAARPVLPATLAQRWLVA